MKWKIGVRTCGQYVLLLVCESTFFSSRMAFWVLTCLCLHVFLVLLTCLNFFLVRRLVALNDRHCAWCCMRTTHDGTRSHSPVFSYTSRTFIWTSDPSAALRAESGTVGGWSAGWAETGEVEQRTKGGQRGEGRQTPSSTLLTSEVCGGCRESGRELTRRIADRCQRSAS